MRCLRGELFFVVAVDAILREYRSALQSVAKGQVPVRLSYRIRYVSSELRHFTASQWICKYYQNVVLCV